MFHHSTTLHHRNDSFSFFGRENRLVRVSYLEKGMAKTISFWDNFYYLRKALWYYSYSFGFPFLVKGLKYGWGGVKKSVDGIEWSGRALREGALGTAQMTVVPAGMLAWSRVRMVKRMVWDVPIETVKTVVKTPIALATSPLELARGVRDGIKSIPGNAMEIYNAITGLRVMDTLKGTRKAVSDTLISPAFRPVKPIVAPFYSLVNTAAGAELQSLATLRTAVTETIPNGGRRVWNAPTTASEEMAEVTSIRTALREQERAKKRERWEAIMAKERGEPANDNAMPKGKMKRGLRMRNAA